MTIEDIASALSRTPLDAAEIAALLDLARDVAHATERKNAPLATFLIGLSAAGASDRSAAIRAAAERVRAGL